MRKPWDMACKGRSVLTSACEAELAGGNVWCTSADPEPARGGIANRGLGRVLLWRASVCEQPRPGHSQPDKADAAVCVHPRPGHSQPDLKRMLHAHGTRTQSRGKSRPGVWGGYSELRLWGSAPGAGPTGWEPCAASAWSVRGAEPTAE